LFGLQAENAISIKIKIVNLYIFEVIKANKDKDYTRINVIQMYADTSKFILIKANVDLIQD